MPAPADDATLPATRRRKSLGKRADRENATVDFGTASLAATRKKSRSKSIGPGGLDALKPSHGNRRVSLAAPTGPPPRSILKPTIPLIPDIPPHKPKQKRASAHDEPTKVALRTEEEQQAAAREREERERAALEKEIKDRREARRKSLANRRVSFAAEATLHTFHEIEYQQESTTSTDSTRRASSLAPQSPAPPPESDASEPPSTPPEHFDDPVGESPADQRGLHQKKRRRSSAVSPLDAHDDTFNSTVYDSDSDNGDDVVDDQGDEGSEEDSDADDGTMMTLDADEVTSASGVTAGSISMMSDGGDSTSSIDEMLRLATQRAGVGSSRQAEEEEEVIPAFMGWGKKAALNHPPAQEELFSSPVRSVVDDEASDVGMDMDVTHAMGGIVRDSGDLTMATTRGMDLSMDMTRMLGGIVSQATQQASRRQSPQREVATYMDQTMEFTTAMGGIQPTERDDEDDEEANSDSYEDMSMEMTTVMGGVWSTAASRGGKQATGRRRTSMQPDDMEAEKTLGMDMTVGLGRIISGDSRDDDSESTDGDATMGMDMSPALGGIVSPSNENAKTASRATSPSKATPASERNSSPIRSRTPTKTAPARGTLSRSPLRFAPQGNCLRRSPERRLSPVRMSPPKRAIGASKSPEPLTTPSRSSPSRAIHSGSKSPMRFNLPPAKKTPTSSPKRNLQAPSLFHQDPNTGATTPLVALTPQRKRLSGVGADRSGLGSPKVAQILDRRASIGDSAMEFTPGRNRDLGRAVKWDDPRILEQEEDRERQREMDREDPRKIMEREANWPIDERDVTLNLREMIQGLSPKKNPLRGRKSLHVGSAKGLLGKRPSELDESEEAEENDGIKRLKNHQGSPVKSIKLQHPPSKEEMTGRISRSSRSQESTVTLATPTLNPSPNKAAGGGRSPQGQRRFMDVGNDGPVDFGRQSVANAEELLDEDDDSERISLQDFLNMTSIRFMELTTTKRRHTVMPSANADALGGDGRDDMSFERCVVAGACTVPMLELYQHSCRELKKYMSEGREVVRVMEAEVLQDNPPLFGEYMSASPEFKLLMDNQFKNVKAHARLLSKAMWYEWRMKLQDGVKEGLDKIAEDMESDDELLRKQQELIDSVLPGLTKRLESLEREHAALDEAARELADCDPEELQEVREELLAVTDDIEQKKIEIARLERELAESEEGIASLTQQKQQAIAEIKEAERVREECRGWSLDEIMALKARVEDLESQHGWAVTGCSGTTISMTYRREIELVFDPTTFTTSPPGLDAKRQQAASNIDIWYIADSREQNPVPLRPELDFFLQCIREQIRGLDRTRTPPGRVLAVVAAGWAQAQAVAAHVRSADWTFPTRVGRTSDTSVAVRSTVLLAGLKTKVEVVVDLEGDGGPDGLRIGVKPTARVVYGQRFNTDRMVEFLTSRIGDQVLVGGKAEAWGDVLVELQAKLVSGARQ